MRCAASTQSSERFPLFPVLSVGTGFSTRRFAGCFYARFRHGSVPDGSSERMGQGDRLPLRVVRLHDFAPYAVPRHGNRLTHEPTTHPDGRSGAGFTSGSWLSSPLCNTEAPGIPSRVQPSFLAGCASTEPAWKRAGFYFVI